MKALEVVKIENELSEMNRARKVVKNKNSVQSNFPEVKRTWKHRGSAF